MYAFVSFFLEKIVDSTKNVIFCRNTKDVMAVWCHKTVISPQPRLVLQTLRKCFGLTKPVDWFWLQLISLAALWQPNVKTFTEKMYTNGINIRNMSILLRWKFNPLLCESFFVCFLKVISDDAFFSFYQSHAFWMKIAYLLDGNRLPFGWKSPAFWMEIACLLDGNRMPFGWKLHAFWMEIACLLDGVCFFLYNFQYNSVISLLYSRHLITIQPSKWKIARDSHCQRESSRCSMRFLYSRKDACDVACYVICRMLLIARD